MPDENDPAVYYNPVTGLSDSAVKYSCHRSITTGEVHWMPPGLKYRHIRTGDTHGYSCEFAANGDGYVWVKSPSQEE